MLFYQYRKSHCGDETVVRSSSLPNGISYTGKMVASLYWISPRWSTPSPRREPVNTAMAFMRFRCHGDLQLQPKRVWMCSLNNVPHYVCRLAICMRTGQHVKTASSIATNRIWFYIIRCQNYLSSIFPQQNTELQQSWKMTEFRFWNVVCNTWVYHH